MSEGRASSGAAVDGRGRGDPLSLFASTAPRLSPVEPPPLPMRRWEVLKKRIPHDISFLLVIWFSEEIAADFFTIALDVTGILIGRLIDRFDVLLR